MTDVRVTQAQVLGAYSEPSVEIRADQVHAHVAYSIIATGVQANQVQVQVAEDSLGTEVRSTQAHVLVAVKFGADDPSVRAWTFTLDGHDMYVLRLGNTETLVYDMHSEQWYQWGSGDTPLWNVYHGENWIDGRRNGTRLGSNVLVGSDGNGTLWFLDTTSDVDDQINDGADPIPFHRRITAQVPVRGYDSKSIYEIQLIGTSGELSDSALTGITLSYSDDRGDSFVNAGTVTPLDADYTTRVTWRSMGSFREPGRIIRIEDDGALRRIDSLTMNSDLE